MKKKMSLKKSKSIGAAIAVGFSGLILSSCGGGGNSDGIDPKIYTDSLFAVMKADRTNYTKLVVKRLGPAGANAIKPDEHWKDIPNGTLLPAQMFRAGAEAVAEMTDDFTYSLQSIWPINSQNAPKTPIEKEGLEFIASNPGDNFYGKETLGDTTYFTAVYPDVAVSDAVMGGVVIRVPL